MTGGGGKRHTHTHANKRTHVHVDTRVGGAVVKGPLPMPVASDMLCRITSSNNICSSSTFGRPGTTVNNRQHVNTVNNHQQPSTTVNNRQQRQQTSTRGGQASQTTRHDTEGRQGKARKLGLTATGIGARASCRLRSITSLSTNV